MGTTEQSSPDGSCIFRAPLDLGEGAWARSQALRKSGPANDICCIGLGRSHRKPEGGTHQQTSLSTEDQGCCDWNGGKIDTCEGAITCSERVAIRLAGKQAGPWRPTLARCFETYRLNGPRTNCSPSANWGDGQLTDDGNV